MTGVLCTVYGARVYLFLVVRLNPRHLRMCLREGRRGLGGKTLSCPWNWCLVGQSDLYIYCLFVSFEMLFPQCMWSLYGKL